MPMSDFMEDVCLLVLTAQEDGLGGTAGEYRRGMLFQAGFVPHSTAGVTVAERPGARCLWRVFTPGAYPVLHAGDVLLRLRDQKRYRITAPSVSSPDKAFIPCCYADAEVFA